MKLLYAPTSPYARKARMVIIEKSLEDRVELVDAIPYDDPAALLAANPLGKVPALITDDGRAIFDSPVICHYLDNLTPPARFLPEGEARWDFLVREALCDGITDAALNIVMEGRRPEEYRSPDAPKRWRNAILRSVAQVETDIAGYEGPLTLAQMGLGAALGYLDLRMPDMGWRDGNPRVTAWYENFSQTPAMLSTSPDA
mgnify:CR=1 FL=1